MLPADLTQDTFVRVMQCDELAQLREPRAFLTTTAGRLLIDHLRHAFHAFDQVGRHRGHIHLLTPFHQRLRQQAHGVQGLAQVVIGRGEETGA